MSAKALQECLKKELHGIKRPPALLFNCPGTGLETLHLDRYEVLPCEPLHDVRHHIQNLFDELPLHVPADICHKIKQIYNSQIQSYLVSNAILSDNQHAYKLQHSTASALVQMSGRWLEEIDKSNLVGAVLWDFSAAFDVVNQSHDKIIVGDSRSGKEPVQDKQGNKIFNLAAKQRDDPILGQLVTDKAKNVKPVAAGWQAGPNTGPTRGIIRPHNPVPDPRLQLLVPRALVPTVLRMAHSDPLGGNLGIDKAVERVKFSFYWPGLSNDVKAIVAGCLMCQRTKGGQRHPRAPLCPSVTGYPNERVAMDIVGPLTKTMSGHECILVATDYFTKYVDIFPLENETAESVAAKFYEGAYVAAHQRDWDVHLPAVRFAYNTSCHATTGFSPFFLMHGREARLPLHVSPTYARSVLCEPRGLCRFASHGGARATSTLPVGATTLSRGKNTKDTRRQASHYVGNYIADTCSNVLHKARKRHPDNDQAFFEELMQLRSTLVDCLAGEHSRCTSDFACPANSPDDRPSPDLPADFYDFFPPKRSLVETTATLRDGLVTLCTPLRLFDGPPATVRCDPAPGFQALVQDSWLANNHIQVDLGQHKNVNKNPVAERAIEEVREELRKADPFGQQVSSAPLAVITAQLNAKVRANGLSSREFLFQRDQFCGKQIPISDKLLLEDQNKRRIDNHTPSARSRLPTTKTKVTPSISVGDLVYLHADRSKSQARHKKLKLDSSYQQCPHPISISRHAF
ncbi:hypothetical protein Bbelb_334220 [Branchiostoma belcheri]|nr:hypothetical protein Bbelb_334220 [Branchiostoma belcheri]